MAGISMAGERTLLLLFRHVGLVYDEGMPPFFVLQLQRVADVHHAPGLLPQQAAQHACPLALYRVVGVHAGGMVADIDKNQLHGQRA